MMIEMMKRQKIMIAFLAAFLCLGLYAQHAGDIGVHAGGGYSGSAGELRRWFRGGYNARLGAGQQINGSWYVEGAVEYGWFTSSHEILDNEETVRGEIPLSLMHAGVLVTGKYRLIDYGLIRPFFSVAGGPVFWKGVRGSVAEYPDLAIPAIEEKILQEVNMAFRGGLGADFFLTPYFSLEAGVYGRL